MAAQPLFFEPMKRFLGVDCGSKRIGLAVGDDATRMASPLTTVEVQGTVAQQVAAVVQAAKGYDFDALVVGLPLNMDDSEGPASKSARKFGEALAQAMALPLSFMDERLSTHAASDLLIPAGLTRKKMRARVDRVAAQVLLQAFLDDQTPQRMTDPLWLPDLGVIFDMDGVLVDSADAHLQSWKLLAGEHQRTIDDSLFTRTFGRTNADIVPLLFGDVTPAELRRLADRKEELYRDLVRDDPPVVPGAMRLIAELYAAGARMAIGSSGPPLNIALVRDALDAKETIPYAVSGDDITCGKPDPEVFVKACAKLDLPPARCVVIEDAPVGIQAAKAAGAFAIAVLIHHSAAAFPTADLLVRQLSDLTVEAIASLVEG